MATISTIICRPLVLWLHLGVAPMIGGGPMQARPGRPKQERPERPKQERPGRPAPVGTRDAAGRRPQPATDKVLRARPIDERADAA